MLILMGKLLTAMCDSMNKEIFFVKRKGGTVLLNAGFQYYRHQMYKNKSSVWRCSLFKNNKCPGSVTINEDNYITKEKAHKCSPNYVKNEIALKVDDMRKEVVNTDTPIPKIYNENISKMKDDGYNLLTNLPTFQNLYHGLYMTRNKSLNVNKTVYTNAEEVEVPAKFYNNVLADYFDKGERILIFCSNENKKIVSEIKEFFIDGTFKSCPKPFSQLYCVHGEVGSSMETTNVIPLIYILLVNKKEQTYHIAFEMLKSQLPQFVPVKVHCDMELAAINAVLKSFPNVKIALCYYHWTKNIWKNAKLHKITSSKAERRIVALCAALPLLPTPKLQEGWEYIKNECCAKYFNMTKFLNYIEKFWLKKHWNKISVFGERHRTNNPVEGWHAKLNREINKNNVTLLRLLNVIRKFENMVQHKQNTRKKGDILNDEVIRYIQMELIHNEIGVGHALEKFRV